MKLSDFEIIDDVSNGKETVVLAEVTVTKGFLFWKTTERATIFTDNYYWRFVDTGRFTPDSQAEDLYRVHCVKKLYAELKEGVKK